MPWGTWHEPWEQEWSGQRGLRDNHRLAASTFHETRHVHRLILTVLLALSLAACSREAAPIPAQGFDPVLVRARALQALVCVQLQRVPPEWKSDLVFRPQSGGEMWEVLSDQPLMDHAKRISSVYSRSSGNVYLVLQDGFPETILVYGPIPPAPQCGQASDQ